MATRNEKSQKHVISKEITRDLINQPTSWIANSKKIKDKDCYSFYSLFFILLPFNMVRKISWWWDPGNPHQDSWRERKRYFFWFSSWKINYHHSFNILSDIHLEWVFCSLASLSSLIFFSIVAHSYLFLSEQKPRKNNDIKNNNIFLCFVSTVWIIKLKYWPSGVMWHIHWK